ncbi:MAG: prepilin-type N-terminal cleavage/methylation domain-containing protein [Elusimicrobia bacterium]|nr:prepilin-type N-terminal cleavage/methylation domain-containing protein [Elusimicrobiota bacterium]
MKTTVYQNNIKLKGYSLIELMMVVAIIGIVASIGPNLMTQTIRFFTLNRARIEIQRDGRTALDNINRNLRQAKATTVTVDQVTNQPPYSRLIFSSVDGRNFIFYQQNKTLYMVEAGSTKPITTNLRYIGFTYPRTDDSKIISVAITLEKDTYSGGTKALQLSVEKVRIMND